jgi:hypothetical protein
LDRGAADARGRLDDPEQVYSVFPAPLPSAEGYRIVWVHSTGKAARDAAARQARIEACAAAIDALAVRLAGPKCRLKTRVAVEDEATAALARAGADRWISYTVAETVTETFRQEHRGRPGTHTRYRRHTNTRHTISWDTSLHVLAHDAATDGCFPLITNDTTLTDAQVLAAYRYQPNLERRHHVLKSVQDAAPLLLHSPARIEALFCCQFLAMLLAALIERQIRTAMTAAATHQLPIYPELRGCTAPSTERILELLPTSLATSSTATDTTSRPSNPRSTPCSGRSSTCSASPPAPIPPPHRHHDHYERWGRILPARSAERQDQRPCRMAVCRSQSSRETTSRCSHLAAMIRSNGTELGAGEGAAGMADLHSLGQRGQPTTRMETSIRRARHQPGRPSRAIGGRSSGAPPVAPPRPEWLSQSKMPPRVARSPRSRGCEPTFFEGCLGDLLRLPAVRHPRSERQYPPMVHMKHASPDSRTPAGGWWGAASSIRCATAGRVKPALQEASGPRHHEPGHQGGHRDCDDGDAQWLRQPERPDRGIEHELQRVDRDERDGEHLPARRGWGAAAGQREPRLEPTDPVLVSGVHQLLARGEDLSALPRVLPRPQVVGAGEPEHDVPRLSDMSGAQ